MCNRLHLQIGHGVDTSGMGGYELITYHNQLHRPPQVDSTPMEIVEVMLCLANINSNDILYDIGCGDGRVLIEAAKYTKKVHGIEIKPRVADYARGKLRQAGINSKRIITGDATKYVLDKATIVTMYLYPDTIEKIIPRLGACKVLSVNHPIPGHKNQEYKVNDSTIYLVDLTWKKYITVEE